MNGTADDVPDNVRPFKCGTTKTRTKTIPMSFRHVSHRIAGCWSIPLLRLTRHHQATTTTFAATSSGSLVRPSVLSFPPPLAKWLRMAAAAVVFGLTKVDGIDEREEETASPKQLRKRLCKLTCVYFIHLPG